MAGFLPILFASTGTTPQAASDAASQPTGAEGVFAAVLAHVSGKANIGEGAFPAATDGMFTPAQIGGQPAGSALQRLKLALAATGDAPAKLGTTTGLATTTASFSAVPVSAPAPLLVPEAGANAEEAAATEKVAAASAGAADADGDAEQHLPALPASEEPKADLASGTAAPEGRQPADPVRQPQPEAASPQPADTQDAAEARPVVETGQVLPPADRPVAVREKQHPADSERNATAAPERPAAEQPAEPAILATTAYPAPAPAASVAPQPSITRSAAAPASLVGASAAPATAVAAAAPEVATVDAARMTPATGTSQSTDAPVAPEAEAQPDNGFPARELPTARHDLTPSAKTTSLLDRATMTLAAPATQSSAQPVATAPTAASPAPAEMAALAAPAPAAGLAAPAPRAPSARMAADSAPAMNGAAPAQAEGNAAAPVAAVAETAKAKAPVGRAAEAQQQPAPALSQPAPLPDKPAAAEINPAPADQPVVAGERAEPEQRRLDDGQAAQPKTDAKGGNAQPVPADRPTALTAEGPAGQPAAHQTAAPEGMQPLAPQPAAGQSAAGPLSAQPHPTEHVRVATPQQLPEAMGLAISRHVSADSTEFTLRLDPAELGRVEVKLDIGKDGQTIVSIQADNASTFDLLRRDSQALERALADAGLKLDSGGLNFSLRQQDGQGQQQFAGENNGRAFRGLAQDAALAGHEPDNTPRPSRRSAAGLLDLSI